MRNMHICKKTALSAEFFTLLNNNKINKYFCIQILVYIFQRPSPHINKSAIEAEIYSFIFRNIL